MNIQALTNEGYRALQNGTGPFAVALAPHLAGRIASIATENFVYKNNIVQCLSYGAAFTATVYGLSAFTAIPLATIIAIQTLAVTSLWITGAYSSKPNPSSQNKKLNDKIQKQNEEIKTLKQTLEAERAAKGKEASEWEEKINKEFKHL